MYLPQGRERFQDAIQMRIGYDIIKYHQVICSVGSTEARHKTHYTLLIKRIQPWQIAIIKYMGTA